MMPSFSFSLVDKVVLALAAVGLLVLSRIQAARRRQQYPPGPPPRFFWGNFFDFPKDRPYKAYAEWAKAYGDVIHLESFGQHIVVLNTQEASLDLLEKRSSIYSDRAVPTIMAATGWPTWNMALSPYGKHWRDMRKLGQQRMSRDNILQYRPIQAKRAVELLGNLLETPENFLHHIRTQSAGGIMSIIYGYDVAPKDDPFVELVDEAVRHLSEATVYPGSDVLNNVSFLDYLPSWLPLKKRLSKARELSFRVCSVPFGQARQKWLNGTAPHSFVTDMLSKFDSLNQSSEEQDIVIRDVAGSLYAGGADTTPSTLSTFILAMACHPEVQKNAQAEIDRVIGGARLPDHSDRENLPYLEAIMREVFRCSLVLPHSIGHITRCDDIYNGYFIPKGTIVMSNTWAINNDERVYENPSAFNPSRHLNPAGELSEKVNIPESPMFGHGRRKCPGRYLAEATAWITMAYLLSAFEMSSPKDDQGKSIKFEEAEYVEGSVYHPKHYQCKIVPRSEKTRELVAKANSQLEL